MNQTPNKNPKKPFSQRLCEKLDIPVGTVGRISFIEAVGNRELCISGCEGLISYTDKKVILELCDSRLTVTGAGLELRSFSGGRISVSGMIAGIVYGEENSDAC